MIARAAMLLIGFSLCLPPGEAEARAKVRAKRVAALDLSRLVVPLEPAQRREARWSLGEVADQYDDGSGASGMRWRLRGAGFRMRMPIAFSRRD
jgi:hypothetical protein